MYTHIINSLFAFNVITSYQFIINSCYYELSTICRRVRPIYCAITLKLIAPTPNLCVGSAYPTGLDLRLLLLNALDEYGVGMPLLFALQ